MEQPCAVKITNATTFRPIVQISAVTIASQANAFARTVRVGARRANLASPFQLAATRTIIVESALILKLELDSAMSRTLATTFPSIVLMSLTTIVKPENVFVRKDTLGVQPTNAVSKFHHAV